MKRKIFIFVIVSIILIVVLISTITTKEKIMIGKKDDWLYQSKYEIESSVKSNSGFDTSFSVSDTSSASQSIFSGFGSSFSSMDTSSESYLGFSTGGAKNAQNFRENIKNGYFPIFTDITYNGLFYDYSFDTGNSGKASNDLFYPSYSTAISKDIISEKDEYYMSVGLNSNIKESDFKRKKLNLVIVLDNSGSMGSSFNEYYYDGKMEEEEETGKTKMKLAEESINGLLNHLKDDDRLGMVIFDDTAHIAKELNLLEETNMKALKKHILDINAEGGTDFEAGYEKATKLFNDIENDEEYDNRIIVVTDAMPNIGTTSNSGLEKKIKRNSDKGIYTTFVGVGVDFNTELIETLGTVKGANYYSVHNSEEFKKTMDTEFDFMVTPLVFDLELNFDSKDYEIEEIYGTDNADKKSGNIMKVNTLFPSSRNESGEVKGGIILLKLKKVSKENNGKISLNVEYEDKNGEKHSNSQNVNFNSKKGEYYDNTGIRKAIVLTRYANVIKNWILYERCEDEEFLIDENSGIIDCEYSQKKIEKILGEQERTSVKLSVSKEYKDIFKKLKEYIENEEEEIKDETLEQEIDILDYLI